MDKCINLNSTVSQLLIFRRLNKIAILFDIEKEFLQISFAEKDRDAVTFLFTKEKNFPNHGGEILTFKFNCGLLSVNSSPFLLAATIKNLVQKFHEKYSATT